MKIYEKFPCCLHDPQTEGLRTQSPFFRITRKISPFGTCHFKIIARNIKAIFRENFSSLRVDAGKIFEITTFIRGPRATYCTSNKNNVSLQLKARRRVNANMRLVLTFYSPSLRRSKTNKRQRIFQLSMVFSLKVNTKKFKFHQVKQRNTEVRRTELHTLQVPYTCGQPMWVICLLIS